MVTKEMDTNFQQNRDDVSGETTGGEEINSEGGELMKVEEIKVEIMYVKEEGDPTSDDGSNPAWKMSVSSGGKSHVSRLV